MGEVDYKWLEEKFFLTLHSPESSILTMPAADLMQAFLISGKGTMLDLSLANLTVQLYEHEQAPFFSFRITQLHSIEMPAINRENEYEFLLASFYREQVRPLLGLLSELAQISVISLWGQIANVLYAQLEEDLAEAIDETSKQRILDVFRILTQGVGAEAFGLRKNPFDIQLKYIEDRYNANQTISVKPVCCLAYRLDADFGYCYTCPRLKEQDRAELRAKCSTQQLD